LTIIKKTEF